MTKTQEQIALEFRQLKQRSGLTWPQIAKAAGYNSQSSIQRYYTEGESQKNYLPPNIIEALLKIMPGRGDPPIQEEDIMLLAPLQGFTEGYTFPVKSSRTLQGGLASAPYSGSFTGADKIPVLAYAAASGEKNAINLENDVPIRWIDRPPQLIGVVKAAAAHIMGDSMEPRYQDGETVYINMAMPPMKGKDCLYSTKDGYTHIKKFLRQDKEYIYVHQYNPAKDIKIHKRDIESIYAIVGRD